MMENWDYTVLITRVANDENVAEMNFRSLSDAKITYNDWVGRVNGNIFDVTLWDNVEQIKLK